MMDSAVQRPTVLVIDDDPANLRVFQRVFRKLYDVLIATSGPDAFELLRTHAADVAFVDYQMPGMDGVQVLEELQRRSPAVVRYLLTGNCDSARIEQLRDTDLCEAVLSKPWDRADIEAAMLRGLARRSTSA